jgi:hypothetical protein
MDIAIILIMFTPLVCLFVMFICYTFLWFRKESVRIENERTRLLPDCRGNYPIYLNPTNGISYAFDSGNTGIPQNVYIIPGTTTGTTRATKQIPLINRWTDYTPLETGGPPIGEPGEPGERAEIDPEIYSRLLEAKRRGLPQSAITSITGATKSGNPNSLYQKYLSVWKGII